MSSTNLPSQDPEFLRKLKLPPHSIEAEQAVLGALLQDNLVMENVQDLLKADDFYRLDHQEIFARVTEFYYNQQSFDILTVYESFTSTQKQQISLEYLQYLVVNTPTVAHAKSYAQIIRQRAVLRDLISVSHDISSKAFEAVQNQDVTSLLDEAERRILAINEKRERQNGDFVHLSKTIEEVYKQLENQVILFENSHDGKPKNVVGVSTGFVDLDSCTSGFQRGDLIIVAARPSMGKTAFSINIAEHVAFQENLPVAIFSMEMGAAQLVNRMLCTQSEVPQQRLKIGNILSDEWPRLMYSMAKMRQANLFIDETAALTPHELKSRARRLSKKQGRLGLIVVDYLQLMSGGNTSTHENRATEISEISRSLKTLAKEMDCPVVALSQLNRSVEQRPNKVPMLSDLRESGAIEQDADVILFIYRDEVYNPESEKKGLAEIKIGKQRNGAAGNSITLAFQGMFSRFCNYADPNKESTPINQYE
jgi:replicative DNA helicase